jgi:DNA-binding response OmpR family regulator
MGNLVLIIDQDDVERRYISTVLAADGFDIIQVASVVEGMVQEMAHDPVLIVVAEETAPVRVDEVIALLRRLSNAPVMIVGGGGDSDELASLRSGGDYYLARPYRGAELTARARLLIQRAGSDVRETGLQAGRPGLVVERGRVA